MGGLTAASFGSVGILQIGRARSDPGFDKFQYTSQRHSFLKAESFPGISRGREPGPLDVFWKCYGQDPACRGSGDQGTPT